MATSRCVWWFILQVLITQTCSKFNHNDRMHIVAVVSKYHLPGLPAAWVWHMSRFYHLLLEATSRYIWWLVLKVLIIETCQKFNHTNRIHIVVVASIQNFRQVQRPAAAMQLTDPQLGGHIGTKHRVNPPKKFVTSHMVIRCKNMSRVAFIYHLSGTQYPFSSKKSAWKPIFPISTLKNPS